MSQIHTTLEVKGLGKQKMAAVVERARHLGMTPTRYLRHLVEEDLAISERAISASFEELLGPGEATDETEVDALVEDAKVRLYRGKSQKK